MRAPRLRLVSFVLTLLGVTGLGTVVAAGPVHGTQARAVTVTGTTPPNIVFVLTDDLSWNLLQYMPHVVALQHEGMTFTNYTVTDSLCCPSRASILTGQFPHNTGVVSNTLPDGGFYRFDELGDEQRTFAVSLQGAGYRSALMGKYLNAYGPKPEPASTLPTYAPPGWTSWAGVNSGGYDELTYNLALPHAVLHFRAKPADYLTDVITGLGNHFIASSVAQGAPFALELATFAPHSPSTPALQDQDSFPGLAAPRTPAFATTPANPPAWLAGRSLSDSEIARIDASFRRRVQSVQAVDRMLASVEATVARLGQTDNTVFVFSSDNGYHLGEYNLEGGKQTAFDTDVRVPLVVAGPGIAPGSVNDDVVENIDLAPTFDELAGVPVPTTVDGKSIVPLLHGLSVPWRSVALVEHTHPAPNPNDPDGQGADNGNPPSYDAIRTATYTYVQYDTGEHEYYDRTSDPYELDNIYDSLPPQRQAALERTVKELTSCVGEAQCSADAAISP